MKVIPKFQQGGGFDSFFTIYKPIQAPRSSSAPQSTTTSRNTKDDSDKGKLTDKDVATLLKDSDALPNEQDALTIDFLNTLDSTSHFEGLSGVSNISSKYVLTLNKLKKAKFNKEQFDATKEAAQKGGYLKDIAISSGGVAVMDKQGKMSILPLEEYIKQRGSGKYQTLTNDNILWLRSQRPEYIYRNDLFEIVNNGTSLTAIATKLKSNFQELGKSTSSQEVMYKKGAIAKGAETLDKMIALGPEGYYKYKTELTTTDKAQIGAALSYLYTMLDPNEKTRLAIETQNGSQKEVLKIIENMLLSTVDVKTDYSIEYVGTDKSLTKSSKDSGMMLNDIETNRAMNFWSGYGSRKTFIINNGTSSSIAVPSTIMPLVDSSDHNLGANTTLQAVTEGLYSGILDTSSATMGGQRVDMTKAGQVIITDGNIASIDYPCIEENGIIKPNLDPQIAKEKEAADKELAARGIDVTDVKSRAANYTIINTVYKQHQLPTAYNANGELASRYWARFGVMNAKTNNRVLGITDVFNHPSTLVPIQDYKQYVEAMKIDDWDEKNWPSWIEGNADELYQGTLWIPLTNNVIGISHKIETGEAAQMDARVQASERSKTLDRGRQLGS